MTESTEQHGGAALGPKVRRRGVLAPGMRQALGPLLGLSLFCLALWVLHRELVHVRVLDIRKAIAVMPPGRLAAALVLVIVDYIVMTNYDLLAVRYIGRQLSRAKVMTASFLSYAFSNNVGLSVFGAGAMRLRQYGLMGLSGLEVAKLVAFAVTASTMGLLTTAGIVLTFTHSPAPQSWPDWLHSMRPAGLLFVGLASAYLTVCAVRREPLRFRDLLFPLPRLRLALAQVATGALDWLLTASALYVLLPGSLPFGTFFAAYAAGQVAGMISHVPGGVGVLETVLVVSLKGAVPHGQLLGVLLVYRALYYLLPFAVAAASIGVAEFRTHRRALARAGELFERRIVVWLPQAAAGVAFAAGTVMLLTGSLPVTTGRLVWLSQVVPPVVLSVSHFLASLAGLALLILARGLQQRLDAAYWAGISLLAAAMLLAVLRGDGLVTVAVPGVALLSLAPAREQFCRRASLWGERFTPGWAAAVALVVAGSLWLGFFSYRHVTYTDELWWRFGLSADAPRFLRASLGVVIAATVVAAVRLLRPARAPLSVPTPANLREVARIVRSSPRIVTQLALLGDKQFLFNRKRTAFIMYGTQGRSHISLGNPVGPEDDWQELCWDFRQLCDLHGTLPVFYQVGPEDLPRYIDLGLSFLRVGEEAHVPLASFGLDGGQRRELRHEVNRAVKGGCCFEVLPAEAVPERLAEFRQISAAWLADKGAAEKGFSLGYFDEDYLARFPAAVIKVQDRVVAFANVLTSAERAGITVDLMRHQPDCPPGAMTYLFVQLMLWGRREGYGHFSLGMAPLSGFELRELAPMWHRLGHWVYRHGEHFYGFEGLRRYKEKFDPVWEPRYLASPGGLALPRVLADLVLLIGRGTSADRPGRGCPGG